MIKSLRARTQVSGIGERVFQVGAVVAIALASAGAHALPILSGTFAGIAFNSIEPGPTGNPTNYDGTAVTGTFNIDLSKCFIINEPGNPASGSCIPQPNAAFTAMLQLNPHQPPAEVMFSPPASLVTDSNYATGQALGVTFGYTLPYGGVYLTLRGEPNAFFNGGDYGSLHAGVVDLATSTLAISLGRDGGTQVALTSITFDQKIAPVPEPATFSLLAGAAAVGAGLARRRKRDAA